MQVAAVVNALHAQNALNNRLTPLWTRQEFCFMRAAWVEAAECMENTNWAWYKANYGKPITDVARTQIWFELVDIFHFLLSAAIQSMFDESRPLFADNGEAFQLPADITQTWAEVYVDCYRRAKGRHDVSMLVKNLPDNVERLVEVAVRAARNKINDFQEHRAVLSQFFTVCALADFSFNSLICFYYAKQALNKFRWSHGYQDGTYIKHWPYGDAGAVIEDNVYLARGLYDQLNGTDESGALALAVSGELEKELMAYMTAHYPGK
jgi:hypothetical protein